MPRRVVRRRALRLVQHRDHPLYMFTLSGSELLALADIWHAQRDNRGSLTGYQRPVAKRHVRNITRYLDEEQIIFPNPIILALDSSVQFKPGRANRSDANFGVAGFLEFKLPRAGARKPAWVVDGQQRLLAISKSRRVDELVVPVNGFVADDVAVQREQFVRVNSSKPLPKGLLTELLPHIDADLPEKMMAAQLPSALCDVLNQDIDSPFFGLIRRSTMSKEARRRAVVTDTSLVKMLTTSLNTPSGSLFGHRNVATGNADTGAIRKSLILYWGAVRDVFPDAWGLPAQQSRLMHGVGIQTMGRLMDEIMPTVDIDAPDALKVIRRELRRVKSCVRWTEGSWDLFGWRWNEVQNTPSHVKQISSFVTRMYLAAA